MPNHPPHGEPAPDGRPRILSAPAPILCGTDFSEASVRAVEVAAAVAKRIGEALVLVHAINAQSQENLPGDLRESLSHYARAQLHEERERHQSSAVEMVEDLREGAPDIALLEAAAEHHARLLVLAATKGRSISRSLFSGVPEQVAEAAVAPTLVVRDAAPLLRWASGERRLRVLVGADFSAPSKAALRWVHWLQQWGPCELIVIYLEPSLAPYSTADLDTSLLIDELLLKAVRKQERQFRKRVHQALGQSHVRVRFEKGWGQSDAHLLQVAAEERADLIVVGTHSRCGWQRLGHHSISRGVLRYSSLNVACVPAAVLREESPFFRESPINPSPSAP
jgi:nucleotide-binding universal stress UspA family protein